MCMQMHTLSCQRRDGGRPAHLITAPVCRLAVNSQCQQPRLMVLKLEVTREGDEAPSAALRVDMTVGDAPIAFGTGADCQVVFPTGTGVAQVHCTLALQNAGTPTPAKVARAEDLAHSEWELKPRMMSEVKVPALANTDDGGFCQVLQAVKDHTAPGIQPLQFVIGSFDCVVEFENDNFGVAEYANSNSLGIRVNANAPHGKGSELSLHESEPPPADAFANEDASPILPSMARKHAWGEVRHNPSASLTACFLLYASVRPDTLACGVVRRRRMTRRPYSRGGMCSAVRRIRDAHRT